MQHCATHGNTRLQSVWSVQGLTFFAVQVTDENKEEYVNLLARFKMTESIKAYIKAFCDGLWSCISINSLRVFSAEQLGLLISGRADISIKEMQARLLPSLLCLPFIE
jgi:hypothetical protein